MRSGNLMCIILAVLLAFASGLPKAAAAVVHTPVNVTLSGNGNINLDLNHDGITDFVLHSFSQTQTCGMLGSALRGSTKITPTTGDGVVVSHSDFAAVLASGTPVSGSSLFYNARAVVTQFFFCRGHSYHVAGYLGLEFQINGHTHYGWAQLSIDAPYNWQNAKMSTTLIGFAYETISGKVIQAGQTLESVSGAGAIPESIGPVGDHGSADATIADAARKDQPKHSHYKVIDLGTFGGPDSTVNSNSVNTNTKGAVVGGASTSTPDPACTFDSHCFAFHSFKFQKDVLTDLGTLPGGTNSFGIAINSPGAIAGISENGAIDPVTGVADFVATVWRNGQILDLGTFGGSFSLPNAINDRGQAAGGAENTIPDPFNFGSLLGLPSPTQWHATVWQHGSMQDLGTLGDGLDSFAQFVNQRGQAAGISFTNSIVNPETGIPTVDPFFWENGQMVDVGTLGGAFGTVSALNNRGQVTGTSDVTRDETVFHAFLWERGQLQDLGTFGGDFSFAHWIDDSGEVVGGATTRNNGLLRAARWKDGHVTNLGTLNGDPCSFAVGSNSRGQIVGNSFSGNCDDSHPFLWENGRIVDLNALIPPNSGLVLHETQYINERGEITGAGFLANGDEHAFLLIPQQQDDAETGTATQADVALVTQSPKNLPHSRLTPKGLAELRARFAHHSSGFGAKSTK